jgi:Domain of unknown function (DUF4158)
VLVVAEQKLGPYGERTETRRIDGKPGVQVEAEVPVRIDVAVRSSKGETAKLAFLVLLKTFQWLGYFMALRDVPRGIVEYIGHDCGMLIVPDTTEYDDSGTRRRHVKIIRQYLRVKSFDETGQVVLSTVVRLAAERMEDLADIINVAIEELIRESFELPGFSTLHKEAKRGRAEVNRTLLGLATPNVKNRTLVRRG